LVKSRRFRTARVVVSASSMRKRLSMASLLGFQHAALRNPLRQATGPVTESL
jgi:hypothetical protein